MDFEDTLLELKDKLIQKRSSLVRFLDGCDLQLFFRTNPDLFHIPGPLDIEQPDTKQLVDAESRRFLKNESTEHYPFPPERPQTTGQFLGRTWSKYIILNAEELSATNDYSSICTPPEGYTLDSIENEIIIPFIQNGGSLSNLHDGANSWAIQFENYVSWYLDLKRAV